MSDREERITWLMDNQELWFNINRNRKTINERLILAMKKAGLYSWDSHNIKLAPLIKEAEKRINKELDDIFRWNG